MALISDIIDGNSATYSEEGWQGLNRIFVVTGITSANAHAMLYDAMVTLAANGVTIGSLHPTITTAQVQSIGLDSISGNQVKLSVVYNEVGNYPVQYSIASNSETIETNEHYDVDGKWKPLILEYTYPSTHATLAGKKTRQTATINKSLSVCTLSIKRRESISLSAEIGSFGYALTGKVLVCRQQQFVGFVNKDTWTLFGQSPFVFFTPPVSAGVDKRSWLCTGISSESVCPSSYAGGWVFDVTYTFEGRPKRTTTVYTNPTTTAEIIVYGHDVLVPFVDPQTGQVPGAETLVSGTSNRNIQQFLEADFNLLELS